MDTLEYSKTELQEIVKNAVAEKESVVAPFHGAKKNPVAENKLKYLFLNFLGGMAFGLGLLLVLLLAGWLLANFSGVRALPGIGRVSDLLKALGR